MIAALLLGLTAIGPTLPDDRSSQIVTVTWDRPSELCGAKVRGAELGDPDTDATRKAIELALPDRGRQIVLHGNADAPYRCVDALVSALRTLGYTRIGFIAEPGPH